MHEQPDDVRPEPPHVRPARRRWKKLGILGLVAATVLAVFGWLIDYRLTYHTFAWWKVPPEIHYCGRDYIRGTTVDALPTRDAVLSQVLTVEPAGWAVYSDKPRNSGNTAQAAPIPGLPCTMGLVLKQSDNEFIHYGLSGGP